MQAKRTSDRVLGKHRTGRDSLYATEYYSKLNNQVAEIRGTALWVVVLAVDLVFANHYGVAVLLCERTRLAGGVTDAELDHTHPRQPSLEARRSIHY